MTQTDLKTPQADQLLGGILMKAIVYTQYGPPDVLQFKEVERPTPKDNEVLVKVRAASVNAAELHLLRGKPFLMRLMGFGLLKPKNTILGAAMAGRVEAVGRNVKQLQPGQKVLIHGAGGGVGTFAVQIAKSFGAEVTAVCSTRNVDMLRSIGADHVIDYTQEDFTKNGQRYDFIFAVNGYHSIFDYKRALSPKGVYVMIGGSNAHLFQAMLLGPLISMTGRQKMGSMGVAKPNQKDLVFMKELLEAGKVVSVIDRRYPLRETAEAIRYLEKGHAQGKVVITVA